MRAALASASCRADAELRRLRGDIGLDVIEAGSKRLSVTVIDLCELSEVLNFQSRTRLIYGRVVSSIDQRSAQKIADDFSIPRCATSQLF
jgi:hypothetical protein